MNELEAIKAKEKTNPASAMAWLEILILNDADLGGSHQDAAKLGAKELAAKNAVIEAARAMLYDFTLTAKEAKKQLADALSAHDKVMK